MKTIKNFIAILLLFTVFAFFPKADSRKIVADKKNSIVTYAMSHPAHDWEGVCKDVNALIVYDDATKTISQVAVSLKVDAFDSGNANRDSHALEVLEGLKYPKVVFTSSKIKSENNTLTADGNLTFHGITRPISITVTRTDSDKKIILDGKFDILLSQFQVERPSLFGLKTKDEVKLSFKVFFPL
ncbi:YceI family protein [Emticicia sp. BO119]|uniref:YceI family protein n=1 Tax=Emticicia sp. BO119 TaxID=2757768 RepID=UPI0015F0BF38|nr:YceI family protein [Emticicia sp. BO119]MBA4853060.1 YceI family protein [Emticicia sp. BO119]